MSNSVLFNIDIVKKKIQQIFPNKKYQIIAITKTFDFNHFKPLLDTGHINFGENKVQEAESKWLPIIKDYQNIKLHLVGKLQSNKAKKAVKLFNYIHSLDNLKLAKSLDIAEEKINKKLKYFIQVNIGDEIQKNGVAFDDFDHFYQYVKTETKLEIIGLMCIPPVGQDPKFYFNKLKNLAQKYNLKELSMGMSSDYEDALLNDASFIRLGSVLFGKRLVT